MPAMNKFLLGAIATFLLGWFFYAPLGLGTRFVDQLAADANRALANAPNGAAAKLTVDRFGPYYRRLSATAPGLTQQQKIGLSSDLIGTTPGLFAVNWTDARPGATTNIAVAADTGTAPTAEAVNQCQQQVDAAISGKTISFASGGAVLTAPSQLLLDDIAAALGPCNDTRVEVAGHTDAAGGTGRNMRLSEERANVVVESLMTRGIPAARLVPKGYGETKPVDTGATPEAYTKNRRIAFSVAGAGADPAPTGKN
jgi:OmpA-OmpF porin, OOP family